MLQPSTTLARDREQDAPSGGERMTDNLHPNDDGLQGMNAEWAAAMRTIYPE